MEGEVWPILGFDNMEALVKARFFAWIDMPSNRLKLNRGEVTVEEVLELKYREAEKWVKVFQREETQVQVCSFCGRGYTWVGALVWHHWVTDDLKPHFVRICISCNHLLSEKTMVGWWGGFPAWDIQRAFCMAARKVGRYSDRFEDTVYREMVAVGYGFWFGSDTLHYRKFEGV